MLRLTCAGKVFIAGEYACMVGGPALVGTLGPLFSLEVEREPGEHPLPFHELSPAGLYLASQQDKLRGVRLRWQDPYRTPIGVGSSSAQFVLSVAAIARLEGSSLPQACDVLELYWKTVGSSQGLRPSGADILAQWLGGPVVVRNDPCESRKLAAWGGSARFLLAYTGQKAKTHEHLLGLRERGFPRAFGKTLAQLDAITLDAVSAWESGDEKLLGAALNSFQRALATGGLAPVEFTAELERIQQWPGYWAARAAARKAAIACCCSLKARRSMIGCARFASVAGNLRSWNGTTIEKRRAPATSWFSCRCLSRSR